MFFAFVLKARVGEVDLSWVLVSYRSLVRSDQPGRQLGGQVQHTINSSSKVGYSRVRTWTQVVAERLRENAAARSPGPENA
jgi:hypothetical protein